jgi:hypothetical protein
MEKHVRVMDNQKRNTDGNKFMTPELRREILLLKRELRECEDQFSDHQYIMEQIHHALDVARDSVLCLLTNDPFAAWEQRMKQQERRRDHYFMFEDETRPSSQNKTVTRVSEAKANVTKLVTPEMRRKIVDLKKQIDQYVACLGEAFEAMLKLDSLDTAVGLSEGMQCVRQLESCERRKKREQAAKEDEDL